MGPLEKKWNRFPKKFHWGAVLAPLFSMHTYVIKKENYHFKNCQIWWQNLHGCSFTFTHFRRLPPGPWSIFPFLGVFYKININYPHLIYTEWNKKYGDVMSFTLFGTQRAVVVSSDEAIRDVLVNKQNQFSGMHLKPKGCGTVSIDSISSVWGISPEPQIMHISPMKTILERLKIGKVSTLS